MKKTDLLNDIYYQNRSIERSLDKLLLVGMAGIIAFLAKGEEDEKTVKLSKIGMSLITGCHFLLLADEIADIFRKRRDAE